jgi:hypothetical protein
MRGRGARWALASAAAALGVLAAAPSRPPAGGSPAIAPEAVARAPRTPDGPARVPELVAPARPAGHRFLAAAEDDDAWMARMRTAELRRVKPVGTSSIVFKLTFSGGVEAAFRARMRSQARGWANELAAYRIGRALGMDQVPPAISRAFRKAELEERLEARYRGDWPAFDEEMLAPAGVVWGALVLWVPGLRDAELDTPRGIERWSAWLRRDGPLPDGDERRLARDLSMMLCFDYLLANPDRFSGGNLRADRTGARVVVRDHNLAFAQPLPRTQHRRVLAQLRRVERFSRSFVERVRALDAATLREALAGDPVSAELPLLTDRHVADLLDRRDALLSRVAALRSAYGDGRVLAFD